MPRKHLLLLGVMSAAAVILQGCSVGFLGFGGPQLRPTNVEVQLVSQSCFQGEVVPCGWHGKKGGLARRAAYVDKIRAEGAPLLLLDGGDFMHRSSIAEGIASWKEMNRLDYAAVTLGELEFRTWDLVDSLMVAHPLPIVCTNVEMLKGDQWVPIGEPYRILEVSGVRVGVMSVIGKGQLSDPVVSGTEDRIRRLEPMETTRKVAAVLREKADIVVLLAHLDPRAMEQYASSLAEVDVVLGGHMTPKDEGPVLIADALVNRSGTRGAHLGITRLVVSPQNEIVDFGGLNVTLSPDFPENPAVAEAAQFAQDEGARQRKAQNMQRREEAKRKREERLQKQFERQGSEGQGQGQTPGQTEDEK